MIKARLVISSDGHVNQTHRLSPRDRRLIEAFCIPNLLHNPPCHAFAVVDRLDRIHHLVGFVRRHYSGIDVATLFRDHQALDRDAGRLELLLYAVLHFGGEGFSRQRAAS